MTSYDGAGAPQGRGDRNEYALKAKPIGRGGQAEVFEATHKTTGRLLAFKRLISRAANDDAVARMRREIEVGREVRHANVMPVLDAAADSTWLVMPLAEASLTDTRNTLASPSSLETLVEGIFGPRRGSRSRLCPSRPNARQRPPLPGEVGC
jgi:serine/threonine protein kinase